ncbi:beta-Ig-H3/fasciclin [Beutenbergia cavernae DSM 12333]|uniref:Beta-Ig-H3/fasciclin n=1 Tax=Beutenbergia cavernae (strain ATCC BAA-8 / DSM 12333 / CCUG 43141 / JCM 11478 / NBRC 16432 / NCIMB 13614 / HKI 0122) TaxID=471853 RepID=C5C291_BEUC1|nr:fasciclin domain-containing protein [Beutenbergia cavernae]ACQ81716.1 beta-Ig-H3/fasciclin [Beutenbergia cavernae DSM 12333]
MMKLRRALVSVGLGVVALTGATLVASPAAAAPAGTTSLAAVLAADGDTFDRHWYDFDIADQAIAAVLQAKPDSPVAVLADGSVPLTAFLPNDRAFQLLALDLTHQWLRTEEQVLTAVAGAVGIDAVEQVLLYHVVPGVTIDSGTALRSDDAVLTTAQGATFRVDVLSRWFSLVRLVDQDPDAFNPFLIRSKLDINEGNVQIAHGITAVLRPINL